MLSGSRALVGRLLDSASGGREFNQINIYERVLDTGTRTIAIDSIATVSIDSISYRVVRWLCWLIALATCVLAINGLLSSWLIISRAGISQATLFLASAIGYAAIAIGFVFLGRWFRDAMALVVGTSDGSRTLFRCNNEDYLLEVKNFLARKINDNDPSMMLSANFDEAVSHRIPTNADGAAQSAGDKIIAINNRSQIAYQDPGAAPGPANNGAARGRPNNMAHHNGGTNHNALPPTGYSTGDPAGTMLDYGHAGIGDQFAYKHIDFAHELPQIVELQHFYAQHADMHHIERRLSDLELLMRSGAATPSHKDQIRTLSAELSGILQAYPAMTNLFGHVSQRAASG